MRVKKASTKETSFKLLSLLLSLCMIVGLLPTAIFAATDSTVLDAAIFCSDVHGSTSDLSSTLSGVKTSGVDYSSIGFVGDTCLTVADTTSTVQSALGDTDIDVMFSYAASHDTEDGADIADKWDYSGEVENVSDYYLVYTIRETDMQNDNESEADFTTWYNGLTDAQKALPIFIMSHRPLHERRNDNSNAADWYNVISAAAKSSDIVFFWAHNHTGETSVDTNAYYVAKNGSETFTVEGGSPVTPNFTYMNAGYINANNQNPGRINVATTVQITANSLIFQDYTTSGAYSGTYAHNVTVDREFAVSEPAVTLESIDVSGTTEYQVGDELELTVTATYSDGSTANVTADATFSGQDMSTVGAYTVTVTYGDLTDTIDITVGPKMNTFTEWDDTALVSVQVTAQDITGLTVTNVYGEPDLSDVLSDYMSVSVAVEGHTDNNEIIYQMLVLDEIDTNGLVLYHVADDGTLTSIPYELTTSESGGKYLNFTTNLTGIFAYGIPAVPEGYTLSAIEVSNVVTTDYFVGDSLDMVNPVVTAIYTKEGSEDFTRIISMIDDYVTTDGYTISGFDMTVAGEQTVVITYETCTTSFDIEVFQKIFPDETTGVSVEVNVYGATKITASVSDNENVADAVALVVESDTYVAYDIELDGYNDGEVVTVTLPIPNGVEDPVVYYVSDDGETVTKMDASDNGDGTISFETDHFSIYVVGNTAEEAEKDLTLGGTTTTTKTVYVLTSSISSGKEYLIVNGNSAGSYYALANNSGSVTATGVTVKTDSSIGTYIELEDTTDELWTTSGSSSTTLKNGSYYLTYSGSRGNYDLDLSTSSSSWTYASNRLSIVPNKTTYYLRYNSGWGMNSSSSNVYFYVPTEVTVTEDSAVNYTVSASDIEHVYSYTTDSEGNVTTTVDLSVGEALTYELQANGETATFDGEVWTVAVASDPKGILDTTNSTNETLYFTGKTGTAYVRVYYQLDANGDGDVTDDDDYKVWTTIEVTATYPYYTVDITHNSNGTGTTGTTSEYISVTDTIVIKGVEENDTYDLWAKVYLNGETEQTVESSSLTWISNNTGVAKVDSDGNVTFTGENGTAQITVYYEYTDNKGNKVQATDVVTFSVSKNEYIVPEDGTDDFPEYPNQGAIRIDKNATAVGNFSETGLAKIELSMTGVPYGTSTKTDVVVMVDMTASMSYDDVTAAESAVKELIASLVYDEENDKYDSNIQLFVDVFYSASSDSAFETEEYLNNVTISSTAELTAAQALIDFTQSSNGGGTRYNLAMKDVYETLNRDGHADNQFVVFVSDGVATAYAPLTDGELGTTITGNNSETASLAAGWFDDAGEVTEAFETEYYSYMIKTAGIPIYTVGANLTALSDAADVLNHMSSNYSPDGKTATGETKYSFFCTTSGGITDEVLEIFQGIGQDIKEAATNVVVEDKVDSNYSVNFSLPSGVTADEAGMDDFYIQVVGYELDENHERKEDPEVIEKFLFNSDGTITHTIGTTTCGDTCTHVTKNDDGVVTAINGTYFDYSSTADGEILTWKADKLDTTELALQYFVYLDNSAGDVPAADQVEAGTYYTNEYATITYTNFQGNECQQKFPVPSMTWNGAKVSYVFYLVNDAGQPVNRAGKVVPFAEAVFVTNPVSYEVTWNETTGSENMLAENLFASANVPDVYSLYDTDAYYEIRVYQTEGGYYNTDGELVEDTNYNYFIIDGSDSVTAKDTTKVYNTKATTKYDAYGVYSAQAEGSVLKNGSDSTVTVDYQTTDIDYANTTVAFAVVWKPALVEDTVVIDYGLDVVIDVYTNDGLASGVTGVSLSAPVDVEINKGTYADNKKVGSTSITSEDGLWTASVESLTSIRFHLNKEKEMVFNAPVTFYYESGVNYYTYDASGNATLNTTNMYSSVTVIPATTLYYEDNFVTYTDSGSAADGMGSWSNPTDPGDTQAVDRPGESQAMSKAYDADNLYGYDNAYAECTEYSMDHAQVVTVASGKSGMASFSFYGTGFDVISMTDTTTGLIIVNVYDANGVQVKSVTVDNYYGYSYQDGEWVAVSSNDPNALYQVPVMKISGLPYGKYTAKIVASYQSLFDHTKAGSYKFYLDAIRIYDPTGNLNDTANNAYVADGEGWPEYKELRNLVITASENDAIGDTDVIEGIVFIDGATSDGADNTASVSDYKSYGPNNELYLAYGQAVAADLNATATAGEVASIQLAVKTVGGEGEIEVYGIDGNGNKTVAVSETISTATDMYYDITELNGMTLVIKNAGTSSDAIISITNIKTTYTAAQPVVTEDDGTATASAEDEDYGIAAASLDEEFEVGEVPLLSVSNETATVALMSLRTVSVEEDTEVEETPEENVPEAEQPKPGKPEKPGKDEPVGPEKPDNPNKGPQNNSGNKNDRNDKNNGKHNGKNNGKYNNWFGRWFG